MAEDHLSVLSERHRYLKARMLANDERERAALEWALGVLRIFQREAREQSQAILQGDDVA